MESTDWNILNDHTYSVDEHVADATLTADEPLTEATFSADDFVLEETLSGEEDPDNPDMYEPVDLAVTREKKRKKSPSPEKSSEPAPKKCRTD